MSDTLERRLRESMERRSGDVDTPALVPPHVLKRARRRQAAVAALAGLMVAVVVTASVIGARALVLSQGRGNQLGGETTSTRTVRGVSVTFPREWHFENTAPKTRGASLFIVANYSPRVSFLALPDRDVCTPTAALLAVQEQYQVDPGSRPTRLWPTALKPTQPTLRGCGGTETASWAAAGRSFHATALFGQDVAARDRVLLHEIFASMHFGPAPSVAPSAPIPSPSGTLIAQGTDAGTHWVVTARKDRGGGVSLEVELPGQGIGIGVPRGPGGRVPVLSSQSAPLGSGAGRKLLVFGFVSHRVSSVHIEPTHQIGAVYPLSGERRLQAFVVVTTPKAHASVVAENEGGKILARNPLGSPRS
jgi:hypothetical protein